MVVKRYDVDENSFCEPRVLNNKELSEFFFQHLADLGYHIKNCKKLDKYFVFESEDSTVFNFEIKEIPGFLFGLWKANLVNLEEFVYWKDIEYILFAQPIISIDKFKPSRSGLRVPISRHTWKDNNKDYWEESWFDYELKNLLSFMKHNKIKCHYYGDMSELEIWDSVSFIKALKYYIDNKYFYIKEDIKNKIKFTKGVIFTRKYLKRVLKGYSYKACLWDFGDNWSPRLHLYFYSKYDEVYNLIDDTMLHFKYHVSSIGLLTIEEYQEKITNNELGEKLIWKI